MLINSQNNGKQALIGNSEHVSAQDNKKKQIVLCLKRVIALSDIFFHCSAILHRLQSLSHCCAPDQIVLIQFCKVVQTDFKRCSTPTLKMLISQFVAVSNCASLVYIYIHCTSY